MRRAGWLTLLLLAPGIAGAVELDGEIRLRPEAIARGYSPAGGVLPAAFAWCDTQEVVEAPAREAVLSLFPPAVPGPPAAGPPVPTDLDPAPSDDLVAKGVEIDEAVDHEIDANPLNVFKRLKKRLLIDLSAYDSSDPNKRWEGVDEVAERADEYLEESEDGDDPLIYTADGDIQGGLTLAVGTGATNASVGDLLAGDAGVLDVNPFHAVSAQFDFMIRTRKVENYKATMLDVFVIRVRAAYLGAFGANGRSNDDAAAESELSVSGGLAW